jgi:hypothetical protein
MKTSRFIIAVSLLLLLSFIIYKSCSPKQTDTSWLGDPVEYEEYIAEEYDYTQDGNSLKYSVGREIPAGVSLKEVGREIYTNLIDLEEQYNLGGIKLCAEMSADQAGRPYSSFYSPVNITFQPPAELHLRQINVTDSSSNVICRIINGEIEAVVSKVQNDIYRTNAEQPGFIINIAVENRTENDIPVVVPLGQMLETQAPHVQNIVVSNTYAMVLKPYQSKVLSVRAYCAAEKRRNPTSYFAKLTPFILTLPAYVYNSQRSLWNSLRAKPVNNKDYTITFYAWRIGAFVGDDEIGHKSSTGHAFVDIPEIGVVGYGGSVTNHTPYIQYADYKVTVKVNETSLRRAQNKYWEWKNNPPAYQLARYDCTTFVMDIADAAGIYYGPRWLIQFPAGFLRELQTYNN